MKEHKTAAADDLSDGEMKEVEVEGVRILLCRVDGTYYAVGASCPHYGAPLVKGVLSGDRIVCPWHHACFHARSGDLLEPPARDALPVFNIRVVGSDVIVSLPDEMEDHRVPEMVSSTPETDKRTFGIIGGGAAGNAAAQSLRESGFTGRIVMMTSESRGPYDRPNLSKDYLAGDAEEEWMPLRSRDFYEEHGIEIKANHKVTGLRAPSKRIEVNDDEDQQYDALLIATGGRPENLDVPGAKLPNIFTLRSYDDCDNIIAASEKSGEAVIVGASFIAMETAFSLRERGLDVAVVAPEAIPFEKNFGPEIGRLFQRLHEENGVAFHLNQALASFEGNRRVEAVVLESGDTIAADLVVVGIGVKPITDFLQGFDLNADGSISVDDHFRVQEGIFAVGDIASFPDWRTGRRIRIEHWRTAEQQGRIAGQNMAGRDVAYRGVPFFWTKQVGLNLRYVGHADTWDEIIVNGEVDAKEFIAFFVSTGEILAAVGIGRDSEMAALEELMRLQRLPAPDELRHGAIDLHRLSTQ